MIGLLLTTSACSMCEYENYSGPGDTEYTIICLNGESTCTCMNPPKAGSGWGDEANESECGTVVFEDGRIIVSHDSCDPLVVDALAISDWVPVALDYPFCDQPTKKHRCFTELELIDDGNTNNDLWCAFCPEITGIDEGGYPGDAFSICWDNAEDWDDATLDGAVPSEWSDNGWPICEDLQAPIGELVGWTLPMFCSEGVSCLRMDGCSCNCRDMSGNSIGPSETSIIDWWWSTYPDQVPPGVLDDYGVLVELPVEPTCTGEPLSWIVNNGGQWALGTTLELNGFDPAFPPNGELHHTPAWEFLPPTPYKLTSLPGVYIDAIAEHPAEAQYLGARVEEHPSGLVIVACERGSICDRLGFEIGETILGFTAGGGSIAVQYLGIQGQPLELEIGITP